MEVPASTFEVFDIEHIGLLAILYQTGYLTIKHYDPELNAYRLDYPNYEVRQAFTEHFLRYVMDDRTGSGAAAVMRGYC